MSSKYIAVVAVTGLCVFGSAGIAFALSDKGKESGSHAAEFERAKESLKHEPHVRACSGFTNADSAQCHVRVITDNKGAPITNTVPVGFGPAQLRAAYGVSGTGGAGRIIAIVDAYDHPNIQSDLNIYSTQFGIPTLPTCSGAIQNSSVPCFKKVDQRGGTRYPRAQAGWALEIALDVEAAHAMCQDCSVLLVEADSNSFTNLLAAEDRAAALGARAISNSWGGNEFSSEISSSYDGHFNKQNVAITVSSGDSGYGVEYPAASRYVTAVGGTSLFFDASGAYLGETAWNGAGSGCSAYEQKPSWQIDTGCAKRSVADVSAVADPNTGAAVYDSVSYSGQRGWFKVGGTSLSSPLIAAVYALSGNTAGSANSLPYSQISATNMHDVVGGSNGSCGASYLCNAILGYDGPTGLGTPNGTLAF